MSHEPSVTHAPSLIDILIVLALMLLSTIIGQMIAEFVARGMGIDDIQAFISSADGTLSAPRRDALQVIVGINQFFTFIVPAAVFSWMAYQYRGFHSLRLHRLPTAPMLLLGLLLVFAGFPIAQLLLKLNQMIPIGEHATNMEANAARLTEALLNMDSVPALLGTLLVVAVLPAIGEELVFRGVIQRSLQDYGPHIAIWLTAVAFSTFHFQFAGFLPRLFLGALLGYFVHWSGSLWLPIFAHLLNNGAQVLAIYIAKQRRPLNPILPDDYPSLNWWWAAIAIIVFGVLIYRMQRLHNNTKAINQ